MIKEQIKKLNVPKYLNAYLKVSKIEGVYDVIFTSNESKPSSNRTNYIVLENIENKNFSNLRIVGKEKKNLSTILYICLIDYTFENVTYTLNMKIVDYNFYNLLNEIGCSDGLKFTETFMIFYTDNNQMYLCPEVEDNIHYIDAIKFIEDKEKLNDKTFKKSKYRTALDIGGIYTTKKLEKFVYLGTYNYLEYNIKSASYPKIDLYHIFVPYAYFKNKKYNLNNFEEFFETIPRSAVLHNINPVVYDIDNDNIFENYTEISKEFIDKLVNKVSKTRLNSNENTNIRLEKILGYLDSEDFYIYAENNLGSFNPESINIPEIFSDVYNKNYSKLDYIINVIKSQDFEGVSNSEKLFIKLIQDAVLYYNEHYSYILERSVYDLRKFDITKKENFVISNYLNILTKFFEDTTNIVLSSTENTSNHNFKSELVENLDSGKMNALNTVAENKQLVLDTDSDIFVVYELKSDSTKIDVNKKENYRHLTAKRSLVAPAKIIFSLNLSNKFGFSSFY